jgi:hypothetical protein
VVVEAGAMGKADPSFPAPTSAVWDSCRHPWVKLPADWLQEAKQGGLPPD